MKIESCLEIQAYLDGELDPGRKAAIATLCQQDPETRSLYDALKSLRETVRENEPEHRLTDSREFYWSQVQRRIAAEERKNAQPVDPQFAWSRLIRWLVPVGGLAAVALGFTLSEQPIPVVSTFASFASAPQAVTSVEYRSDIDGVTVHWIN